MNSTSDDYERRKARFFRMEEAAKKARSRTNNTGTNGDVVTTTSTTTTTFSLTLNSGNSSSNNNNNTSFTSGSGSTSTSSKRKSSQQQRDYPSTSKKQALAKPMIDLNLSLAPPSASLEEANASLVALQQQEEQQHNPSASISDNVEQRGVSEEVVSANNNNNNNNNDNDGNNLGWPIRKKLKESDVKKQQNRLLIENANAGHITGRLSEEDKQKVKNGGFLVKVHDIDKSLDFKLKLTYWKSSQCHVLNGKWSTDFLDRRELKEDDKVGLRWDAEQNRLVFSVLSRADPKEQKPTQGQVDLK